MTNQHSTATFDALVHLATTMRTDWQSPGIRDAVRRSLATEQPPSLADLAYALIRLAGDPTIRTPAVLAMDGPHWRRPESAGMRRGNGECPDCHEIHGPDAPHVPPPSKRLTPQEQRVRIAAMRAGLAKVRTKLCRHGVAYRVCVDCDLDADIEGEA